jgi:hypothetical protein
MAKNDRSASEFDPTHAERRSVSFDEKATIDFVKAIKLSAGDRRLLYERANANRRVTPLISDFRELYPDFPVYLVVDRQSNLRDTAGLSSIFPADKLAALPFMRDYFAAKKELKAELAGRPLVVLMRWPLMAGSVALHQIPFDEDIPGVRLRLTYSSEPIQRITLEPVAQLLPLFRSYGIVE